MAPRDEPMCENRMLTLRRTALVLLMLVTALAGRLSAGDTPAPATDAHQLLTALPHVPEIALKGDQVVWSGDGATAVIEGVDAKSSDPILTTPLGPIRVARWVVEGHHVGVLPALSKLVALATSAHLAAADLLLQDGLLTGPSLRSADVVVVPQGVMRKQAGQPVERTAEVAHLSGIMATLTKAAENTALDDLGRQALQYVIGKLDQKDGGEALDDFTASFARRVVRHGWLRLWYRSKADAPAIEAIEQAVATAEQQHAATSYRGDGVSLEQMQDAFGRGGWVFSSPTQVRYAHAEVHPEYLGSLPELMVVVDLPAGSDAQKDAAKATGAHMYHGSTLMASWSATTGFSADAQQWSTVVNPHGGDLVPNAIPPHIVVAALNGDIVGLAVDKGLLQPVQDTTRASAERFVADAAAMLPDTAHLDLIGEYLFTYVYPSPEAKHPELMGNRQLKGDVQQTVWQTCGNALGGIMHGDCADIAELYQVITDKQHRNSIIIGLPEHAACAWAEKRDQAWHVSVLQTGPPLAFTEKELPVCLEKAYKSFDPSMTFDANELPLLLRFSGEVSRSEWSLSWRIFSEPDYAHVMFDVQRDWHFQTYQRGIATMTKLIDAGDDDNANYRELSGLYTFTGQYNLAAEFHRKAIARTTEAVSRLYMTVQLVGHLLNAGQKKEAEAAATDVIDHLLPALKDELGPSYLQVGLQLALVCLNEEGGPALQNIATRALKEIVNKQMSEFIEQVSTWLASSEYKQDVWENSNELRSMRGMIAEYCGIVIELVSRVGADQLPGDADMNLMSGNVQKWLDGIAFHDVEDNSSVLGRYAAAGHWYAAVMGEETFDHLLDGVAPAKNATVKHEKRANGVVQMTRDLPWIRASVPYWYDRMAKLFRRNNDHVDPQVIAHLAQRLVEARTATVALGLSNPQFEIQAELGAEVAALIAHDEKGLRAILHRVAEKDDKSLRDDAAQWLGDCARFLDVDWYGHVLAAWRDEVDYKPKYFWIAWRAALNKAPQQALMAAQLAAERFKDDSAFTEEYGFMRALLAPGGGTPSAAAVGVPALVPR